METIAEFRETCINAENMLESCLDTPKIRNGGKVYIKDVSTKKPQQQNKQPIMITKLSGGNTHMQGTTTTTTQADSLSSIIQEVGIYVSIFKLIYNLYIFFSKIHIVLFNIHVKLSK